MIDPLDPGVRDALEGLNEFFADPNWIKVSSKASFPSQRSDWMARRSSTAPHPTLSGSSATLVSTSSGCSTPTTLRTSLVRPFLYRSRSLLTSRLQDSPSTVSCLSSPCTPTSRPISGTSSPTGESGTSCTLSPPRYTL